MIDFEHVWLPQIVRYARIISTGQLEDQWLGRLNTVTSVTDPDELHEQVFGDLDADRIWSEAREAGKVLGPAVEAIDRFLAALHDIDEHEAVTLISSDAWSKVTEAAGSVLANDC